MIGSGLSNSAAPGGTQDIFYSRKSIVPLPMIERAAGVMMWDEAGREFLDSSAGPMVSALGHGNPRVIEAMAAQARKLDYAYSRSPGIGPISPMPTGLPPPPVPASSA